MRRIVAVLRDMDCSPAAARTMRLKAVICLAVAVVIGLFSPGRASAGPITDSTPCQMIADDLNQNNSPQIVAFLSYTIGEFKQFYSADPNRLADFLSQMSPEQIQNVATVASLYCSVHTNDSVRDAAVFAYVGAERLPQDLYSNDFSPGTAGGS